MQRLTLVYVFYGALLLSLPVGLAYVISVGRLFARLRNGHPATYRNLGEPSFLNSSLGNSIRTLKFVIFGEYKSLQDSRVNTLASLARALFIFSLALYCFCAVVLTFYWGSADGAR